MTANCRMCWERPAFGSATRSPFASQRPCRCVLIASEGLPRNGCEVDQRIGLLDRVGECFGDYRVQECVEHPVRDLVAQRVFGVALGYEDLNDHDHLRADSVLAPSQGGWSRPVTSASVTAALSLRRCRSSTKMSASATCPSWLRCRVMGIMLNSEIRHSAPNCSPWNASISESQRVQVRLCAAVGRAQQSKRHRVARPSCANRLCCESGRL